MSSKLETMTEAEAKLLLLLAEMTKLCSIYHSANIEQPCAHSSPHCPICLCKGTSRVYTFPTLRKVCPQQINHRYLDGMPESDNYSEDGAVCSTCQGRGWVVEALLEDLFALARQAFGLHHVAFDYQDDKVWVILTPEGMDYEEADQSPAWAGRGVGATEREATLDALVAAIQAQEEKQSDLV